MICQITKKNQTLFYGIAFVLSLCFGLCFCTNSSVSALEDLSGTADYDFLSSHNFYLFDHSVESSFHDYNGGYLVLDVSGIEPYSGTSYYQTYLYYGVCISPTCSNTSIQYSPIMNRIYIIPIITSSSDNTIDSSGIYAYVEYINSVQFIIASNVRDKFQNISIKWTMTTTRPSVGSCPECEECQECETCPPSTVGGGDYSGVIRAIYICGASVVVCMFFYLILKMFMGVRR